MNKYIVSSGILNKYMKVVWVMFFLAHTAFRDVIGGIQSTSVTILVASTVLVWAVDAYNNELIISPRNFPWFSCLYGLFVFYVYLSKKYGIIVNPQTPGILFYLFQINIPTVFCMEIYFNSRKKSIDLAELYIIATTIYAIVATVSTPVSLWANAKLYGGITKIQRNLASMIYVAAFSLCLYFIAERKKIKLFYVCGAILFVANLITGARKGVIQVVMSFGLFVLLQGNLKDKVKYLKIIIVIVILFIIAYINIPWVRETFGQRMLAVFDSSIEDSSKENRTLFRMLAFFTFLEHPIWGIGCDGFCMVNEAVTGMPLYSHCNYTELLCDYGIVGFLLYYLNYIIGLVRSFINKSDNIAKCVIYTLIPIIVIEYGQIDYYMTAGALAIFVTLMMARNINK